MKLLTTTALKSGSVFRGRERLPGREGGQTLVEYGMLLALLAMAVVFILGVVGDDVMRLFTKVSTEFANTYTP